MTRQWRKALVGAGVLSLGLGSAAFAEEQQQPQSQQEQQQQQQQAGQGGAGQQGQQAELKGEVVEAKKDTVYLRLEQGAVVPVKIDSQTQLQGAEQRAMGGAGQQGQDPQAQQQQQQKMQQQMKGQKLTQFLQPGDKVTVSAQPKAGQNTAQRIQLDSESAQEKEIQGTVASKSGNWINIQHEGALVPVKIDKQTSFEGIQNQQALKEGSQVRANFQVQNGTDNVATRISVQGGQQQQQQPGQGGAFQEGQQQQQPQQPSPGGSY